MEVNEDQKLPAPADVKATHTTPSRKALPQMESFERFTLNERLQHITLFTSFIVLVLTGFPLKYSQIEWLDTIFFFTGGVKGARIIHRTAAVIMIVDFLYHNLYICRLILTKKVRLSDMFILVPSPKDLKDLVQNIRYFLGLAPERPKFDKFSYMEKFDYWAVYWGMFIMAGSGLILWFPEFWTRFTGMDIIRIAYIAHSDEALLAFLAITCWHLYNVHLNPRRFPMNKVWYRGTLSTEEMIDEHPLHYERIIAERQRPR